LGAQGFFYLKKPQMMPSRDVSPKTVELAIWVNHRLRNSPNYGFAFLANSLFFIDYLNYLKNGQPVSDLSYVKEAEGIAPSPNQFAQIQEAITFNRDPNFDVFGSEEIELMEEVLKNIAHRGDEIFNDAKSLLAWEMSEYHEEIPFYTFQYIPNRKEQPQNTIKEYLNRK
jgi:hypothetical protein